MSNLSIAQRLYKREFASEASRQELIDEKAKRNAQDITKNLLSVDSEAIEVADDIIGFMEPEKMASIMRCVLRGDMQNTRLEMLALTMESVKRVSEHRAIKEVEAMTPEDFEQF